MHRQMGRSMDGWVDVEVDVLAWRCRYGALVSVASCISPSWVVAGTRPNNFSCLALDVTM